MSSFLEALLVMKWSYFQNFLFEFRNCEEGHTEFKILLRSIIKYLFYYYYQVLVLLLQKHITKKLMKIGVACHDKAHLGFPDFFQMYALSVVISRNGSKILEPL